MALSYDVCVYFLCDRPEFLSATERGSPYRDFAEIVRKPHSHSAIFDDIRSKIARCPCDVIAAQYDYLKSLRSFLDPNYYLNTCGVLTNNLWCPYGDRAINLRCIYRLRACDFSKFVIVRS